MDPQGNWPLTSQQFTSYLKNKYAEAAGGADNVLSYTQGTIHHYEKIITTIDGDTKTTVIKNVEVDEATYNSIIPMTETKTFPNGSKVTYTISAVAISLYDYENSINEAKRNINLIKSSYANQMETQFKQLVNF
jgi:DNA helicase IV